MSGADIKAEFDAIQQGIGSDAEMLTELSNMCASMGIKPSQLALKWDVSTALVSHPQGSAALAPPGLCAAAACTSLAASL